MATTEAPSPDLPSLLQIPISDPLPESDVNTILSSSPFIPIPYTLNFRTLTSPSLKPNLIFRSGDLSRLPPTSLARLKDDCKITTIFDLRYKKERERQPTPEIAGVENIWMPTMRDLNCLDSADGFVVEPVRKLPSIKMPDDFVANEGVDGFVKMHRIILETHREMYKAVFERLKAVETTGGVLFHCSGESPFSKSMVRSQSYSLTIGNSWERSNWGSRSAYLSFNGYTTGSHHEKLYTYAYWG
jgi:hypothetical protein